MSYKILRQEVQRDFKSLIDMIVKELQEADEMQRGIDLTNFLKALAQVQLEVTQHFDEGEERCKQNPKKFVR